MKNTNHDANEKPFETDEAKQTPEKRKNDVRKQLVSGGVYIALAVTVVAVTVSTITATFSGKPKETPSGDKTLYRSSDTTKGKTPSENPANVPTPSGDNRLSANDLTLDTPVSDAPSGIDATVTPAADASKTKDGVAETPNDTPKNDTPREASENHPEDRAEAAPDKSAPRSEEPDEPTFEIGYEGFVKPCSGFISKEYSMEVPVYSATMYDYRTHAGMDIAADPGTPVKAVSSGTIKDVYEDVLYGTTVVIEHADGVESVYQGLSPDLPVETVVGHTVLTGEAIAGVGNSALCESAEASHLHFEMHKNGTAVNPSDYIVF